MKYLNILALWEKKEGGLNQPKTPNNGGKNNNSRILRYFIVFISFLERFEDKLKIP